MIDCGLSLRRAMPAVTWFLASLILESSKTGLRRMSAKTLSTSGKSCTRHERFAEAYTSVTPVSMMAARASRNSSI